MLKESELVAPGEMVRAHAAIRTAPGNQQRFDERPASSRSLGTVGTSRVQWIERFNGTSYLQVGCFDFGLPSVDRHQQGCDHLYPKDVCDLPGQVWQPVLRCSGQTVWSKPSGEGLFGG